VHRRRASSAQATARLPGWWFSPRLRLYSSDPAQGPGGLLEPDRRSPLGAQTRRVRVLV